MKQSMNNKDKSKRDMHEKKNKQNR